MLLFAPALQDLDTRVRCPTCATVFDAQNYRFFGFVSPRTLRMGLGLATLIFFLLVAYFLLVDRP